MEKKIKTSAENLALLDLAIAKKREPKKEDRVIVVVVGPHYYFFFLEGRVAYFDKVSNTATNILPEASVDDLIKLRELIEVK